MRTTIAIATFLAVGVSAAGVGALNLKGSDTLKDTTVALLTQSADCGGVSQGGSLIYDGTGSGNGQAALISGTQQIAPMSKPMDNGVCGTHNATAEGIVFELDGLSVVADGPTWGTCNGTDHPNCDPDTNAPNTSGAGLAFSKDITPTPVTSCTADADCNDPTRPGIFGEFCGGGTCQYHLSSWKQALRILFFGVSSTDASGNVAKLAFRNCSSPERQFLAGNWYNIMQTQTCSTGKCPAGIQHAFRRNDESGTSDVFVSLVGGPKTGQSNNTDGFCNAGTQGPSYFSASPPDKECSADTDCVAVSPPPGICATDATSSTGKRCSLVPNSGQTPASLLDFALPPPVPGRISQSLTTITICPNSGASGQYVGEYFVDLQDHDPVRRVCKATATGDLSQEDVCSARGDLGLVLPVWDVPSTQVPAADAFPTTACSNGKFACFSAARTSCPGSTTSFELCPDGSDPNAPAGTNLCGAGFCAYPVIAAPGQPLDPRCVASKTTKPPGTATFDGRVFNLTTWTGTGATGFSKAKIARATGLVPTVGNKLGSSVPVNMVGAFYRIHSVHTMDSTGALATCKKPSATDQIGCLVHASPCSIGYAGNQAVDVAGNTIALKVNNVDADVKCVQGFLDPALLTAPGAKAYPLSRKLYLNSLIGFENVTGDQLKMAKCFAASGPTGAASIASGLGFISLPPTDAARMNAGNAFCEDYDEGTADEVVNGVTVSAHISCSGTDTTITNACAGNGTGIPSCRFGETPGTGAGTDNCSFGP